jgi:hypothetical protein
VTTNAISVQLDELMKQLPQEKLLITVHVRESAAKGDLATAPV